MSHASDETLIFTPRFDANGLIGAIIQDASDSAVLMFAFMNAEALAATQRTGFIHFWSRSRQKLWMKGETSGETFKVAEISVDCDQDCLLIRVTPQGKGNACHTGRRSCFYRKLDGDMLTFT
ncbi:MAG: phosphoribosyl-AMP cyclohydrolase [Phyllobacteriaceae bacterium]|nr:phosphoribosyl-AMP cyclohydrolase [Phyllobacteriaceae bacterium]